MAILTHDDFMNRVKSIIGEDTSDESISLLEDFTDTIKDLEAKASANGGSVAEYEQKLKDLDKSWRDKYTARFFDGRRISTRRCLVWPNNRLSPERVYVRRFLHCGPALHYP